MCEKSFNPNLPMGLWGTCKINSLQTGKGKKVEKKLAQHVAGREPGTYHVLDESLQLHAMEAV